MLCRPRSRSRLLRRLRRPLRPLLSSMFRAAGVRGRKVPPRGPSVPCEGHHSPSVSVVCGHPAALRSSAAGSLPLRKSAVPQASQLTSSAPAPRYGFAVVIPGRNSSRPFRRSTCARSSHLRQLKLPQCSGPCSFRDRKAFRAGRIRPSRPLAQTVSVIADLFGSIRRRPESALPATDCAGLRAAQAT